MGRGISLVRALSPATYLRGKNKGISMQKENIDKEKQAITLVQKGMSIEKAAQVAGVSSYWLSVKTGKGV